MPGTVLPDDALGELPEGLRAELLASLREIVVNYQAGRWEPSELNGGKLCEIVYTILHGRIQGNYPVKASKPRNFFDACIALSQAPRSHPHSVRVGIPRQLIGLYEVRNNRNVGHVGGDVDPNHMDALLVLHQAKWVVSELVRLFHDLPVTEAAKVVEALSVRDFPTIWEVNGTRRVLNAGLSARESVLLLLYASSAETRVTDLLDWTEYTNASRFRKGLLRDLHSARLVEFDDKADIVILSPVGARYVENTLPLHLD